MSHQPFEKWLFNQEQLSSPQKQELEQHMEQCNQCRSLSHAWDQVEARLASTPPAAPQAAFAQRWRESLHERRARQQLRLIRIWLISLATPAVVSFLALGIYVATTVSFTDLVIAGFTTFTRAIIVGSNLQTALSTWTPTLPLAIPLAIWILLSLGFCLLAGIWVSHLWQTLFKGVERK